MLDSVKLHRSAPGQTAEYACLSYCWGGQQSFSATRAVEESMCVGIPLQTLGQTIQDAIEVTRSLSIRYLWVDALCIMQDDPNDKAREIQKMGDIYKNATITIAASMASASYSGFNKASVSDPPAYSGPFGFHIPLPKGSQSHIELYSKQFVDLDCEQQPLDSRAWAFQEYLLPPRVLSFTKYEVLLDCHTCSRRQIHPSYLSYDYQTHTRDGLSYCRNSDPDAWMDLVRDYTRRQLSDPDDRLKALAGVASVLKDTRLDDCVFGMWTSQIIDLLGWYVVGSPKGLIKSLRAPTWSWASVDDAVVYFQDHNCEGINEIEVLQVPSTPNNTRTLKLKAKFLAQKHAPQATLSMDTLIKYFSEDKTNNLYYFVLLRTEMLKPDIAGYGGDRKKSIALVVERVQPDNYVRIGRAEFHSNCFWDSGVVETKTINLI